MAFHLKRDGRTDSEAALASLAWGLAFLSILQASMEARVRKEQKGRGWGVAVLPPRLSRDARYAPWLLRDSIVTGSVTRSVTGP